MRLLLRFFGFLFALGTIVLMAWLDVPMATPWATLLRTRNNLAKDGARMAPRTPVEMTAAMVMDAVPPS